MNRRIFLKRLSVPLFLAALPKVAVSQSVKGNEIKKTSSNKWPDSITITGGDKGKVTFEKDRMVIKDNSGIVRICMGKM
ncbi:hypothetical protein [Providencia manganoxydans]|uniref:hypothetical protein n=1 Tax=Providencia manganoxydans TaxID=2923283 RepID=UPI0034DD2015